LSRWVENEIVSDAWALAEEVLMKDREISMRMVLDQLHVQGGYMYHRESFGDSAGSMELLISILNLEILVLEAGQMKLLLGEM
jgi:hypothetical protein